MTRGPALVAVLALVLLPGGLAAQRPELAPLGAFLGRWRSVGESHATRFSTAGRSEADLECVWSAGFRFLACDQQILSGGDSIEQLSAYGPADSGRFVLYAVTPGGRPAYSARVTIAGHTWTYENPNAPATGTRWRTINEWVSPGEMHWRAQFSEDGEHWTTTNEGVTTKVG
ncbi:MAG TPA: hypothetical protein VMF70_02585 [Gemmatimonadales bacterium]|nr:hypothetical protein [Gemmatimonadales bacterium]